MARLIIFIGFLVGLVLVLNLKDFKKFKVQDKPFDFQASQKAHQARKQEIAELQAPKKPPPVEVQVAEGPLVELATPQLKRGAELYKKCVLCHGKRGQGKKSQNAPAIGGQYDWYVVDTIVSMQEGRRVNNMMNPYIKNLSSQDIQDLAAYIAKLPPMGKK